MYGYACGSPDVAKKEKTSPATTSSADLYGYGSGSPDVGKGNAAPAAPASSSYGGSPLGRSNNQLRRRRSGVGINVGPPQQGLQTQSQHEPSRRVPPERRNSAIQVRMRGENRPVQRRRSIDFAPKVHVKEVEPVSQLTNDVRKLWLQADDFDAMKQHRRALLVQYKERQQQEQAAVNPNAAPILMAPRLASITHTNEKNHEDSFRGLERYIDKSGRRTKNAAWDTVLLEQDEQECSGIFDEKRISELYKYTTQESPEKAVARAQQDREAVEEYLMSPRTTKLMMTRSKFKALRRVS
ncbi:MAG: hypothetical protein SGILL_008624, partial [Bacillariaceae sp.]